MASRWPDAFGRCGIGWHGSTWWPFGGQACRPAPDQPRNWRYTGGRLWWHLDNLAFNLLLVQAGRARRRQGAALVASPRMPALGPAVEPGIGRRHPTTYRPHRQTGPTARRGPWPRRPARQPFPGSRQRHRYHPAVGSGRRPHDPAAVLTDPGHTDRTDLAGAPAESALRSTVPRNRLTHGRTRTLSGPASEDAATANNAAPGSIPDTTAIHAGSASAAPSARDRHSEPRPKKCTPTTKVTQGRAYGPFLTVELITTRPPAGRRRQRSRAVGRSPHRRSLPPPSMARATHRCWPRRTPARRTSQPSPR